MKSILFFLFIFSLSSFGSNILKEGECVALPGTKKYVDFDSSTNYPKTYQFTCEFECLSGSEVSKVEALHRVVVKSLLDEARNVVCYGVRVKKVSWGYDFDRVEKFFLYEAGLLEITSWGRDEGIDLNHSSSNYLMDKLVKTLNEILPSFKIASQSNVESARVFGEAVEIMEDLLNELPNKTERLDQLLLKVKSTDLSSHTGLNLVLRILSSSAKWRLNYL
ncbi:hypothetical protein [Halobacteriovorax sp. JY17]|uniref:hypothetical protein n=1 Tax=Halobacteriovorax sp. JY17 TaxID=2014617 RepID=UPI000C40AE4A|nr:hypothetical protein [Halobacteriovorax sp. JY17]PIK15033.1 MAG: hypothetical protein CES88_11915 [Halobacteriovorax sp. JY17]